jgi:hypothetical protein
MAQVSGLRLQDLCDCHDCNCDVPNYSLLDMKSIYETTDPVSWGGMGAYPTTVFRLSLLILEWQVL